MHFGEKIIIMESYAKRYIISKVIAEIRKKEERKNKEKKERKGKKI